MTVPQIKSKTLVSLETFNGALVVMFNQDVVLAAGEVWDYDVAGALPRAVSDASKYDLSKTEVYVQALDNSAGATNGYYIAADTLARAGFMRTGEVRVVNVSGQPQTFLIRVIAVAKPAVGAGPFIADGTPYSFHDTFTGAGDITAHVADVGGSWTFEDFLFENTPMTLGLVGGQLVRTSDMGVASSGACAIHTPIAPGTHDMIVVETTFIIPSGAPYYSQFGLTVEQTTTYAGFSLNYFRSTNPGTTPQAQLLVTVQPNENDSFELARLNVGDDPRFATDLTYDVPHVARLEMQPGLWRVLLDGVELASTTDLNWMPRDPKANLYIECEQMVVGGSIDAAHFDDFKFDATINPAPTGGSTATALFLDTFTGAAGPLSAHVPETGPAWTTTDVGAGTSWDLIGNGTMTVAPHPAFGILTAGPLPVHDNYAAELEFTVMGAGVDGQVELQLRDGTQYHSAMIYYSQGDSGLRMSSSAGGFWTAFSGLTVGTHILRIEITATGWRVLVDGVEVGTAAAPVPALTVPEIYIDYTSYDDGNSAGQAFEFTRMLVETNP